MEQQNPSKENRKGWDRSETIDRAKLRQRAEQSIEEGAVIPNYRANRERILTLLNESLATETVCVLRYKRHYEMAKGLQSESIAAEFLQHAHEEQAHADRLAARIGQLNGEPDYDPSHISARSYTEYRECENLVDMIRENLIAERIVIEAYREMILEIGNDDPTTRRIVERILEEEEEHADDLARLLSASLVSKAG
jgi:bacterioferritin